MNNKVIDIIIVCIIVILSYSFYRVYLDYDFNKRFNFFVIQLDRVSERVNNVNLLKKVVPNLNVLHAIDYKYLTKKDYNKFIKQGYLRENYEYDIVFQKAFLKGQIAVALSHITIWEKVKILRKNYNIIFEDDAYIDKNFLSTLKIVINELPSDYDLLYLFIHKDQNILLQDSKLEIGKTSIIKSPSMFGLVGYMISPKGATKLIHYIKPLSTAIDEAIAIMIKEGKLNAYSLKSSIIKTHGDLNNYEKLKIKSTVWDSTMFM